MVTLEDAKKYLKIDYGDEDSLVSDFIETAENLVKSVGRLTDEQISSNDPTVKTAVLFTVGYLYDNRTNPDYHKLTLSLRSILFAHREGVI